MTLAIDICLCTFKRPQVANTLISLAAIEREADWHLRVIVADNDETPSAREIVASTANQTGLDITYLHAPARNISIARNACLDAATAPLVAFIDDDELVTPGWLKALISTQQNTQADVVLGPVRAIYTPDMPVWMIRGDFHSTMPVWVKSEIVTGYTCNVLLNREALPLRGLRFRTELGRSGGEDTAFFANFHKNGGHIAFASDAVVTEVVTTARASLLWLLRRRFRSGQTHGMLLLEGTAPNTAFLAKNIALALTKACFCYALALPNILRGDRMRFWLLRGTVHLGVISRLLGNHELQQYG